MSSRQRYQKTNEATVQNRSSTNCQSIVQRVKRNIRCGNVRCFARKLPQKVDMVLGQDVFHFIRPLEYWDSDCKNAPVAVRLPLSWVISGPLPATSGLFSTCFKAVTSNEDTDSELVDKFCSWYDMESYGAMKQVDSRSAADARAEKFLDETTYHDGTRYQVGML